MPTGRPDVGARPGEVVAERIGGRFDHVGAPGSGPAPEGRPARSGRRTPLVAAVSLVVVLAAALGAWWATSGDDAEVEVAGVTTSRPAATTTVPAAGGVATSSTEAPGPTVQDPVREAAYAAEVERACAAITADPGLVTEEVIGWQEAWTGIGKTPRTLRDDVNNCSLPARDAAMAAMAAQEEAARQARVAACGQLDATVLQTSPTSLAGRCGVLGVVVLDRQGRACEVLVRWDASGTPPPSGAGASAVLRSGAGNRCPWLDGVAAGWSGRVWATVRGTVDHDGGTLPLLVAEQSEPVR